MKEHGTTRLSEEQKQLVFEGIEKMVDVFQDHMDEAVSKTKPSFMDIVDISTSILVSALVNGFATTHNVLELNRSQRLLHIEESLNHFRETYSKLVLGDEQISRCM